MSLRLFSEVALALAFVFLPPWTARAAETQEGKVVSSQEGSGASDGKLVVTNKEGKGERTHMISSQTKITRNDKSVKLSELKKGDWVKLTMGANSKITEVAASEKSSDTSSEGRSWNDRDASGLPNILGSLNLSADQKEKIRKLCREYNADREAAWKEFAESYREAIGIEASLLASIEDHLSDAQRKSIREHRRRMAHRRHQASRNDDVRKDEQRKDDAKVGADRAVVEEITIIGVTLSPDQEDSAETLRDLYSDRLQSLNGRIEDLHARLIALETERLLEIEAVLTKEQREQLRKEHQLTVHTAKTASGESGRLK